MMPVIPLTVRISALFWKLSSFLIPPERRTAMTVHSTSFPTDQPVPAGDRRGTSAGGLPQPHRQCSRQKSSICASCCSPEPRSPRWRARPGMAGIIGPSAISGVDRRRLCEGRQHHHCAEGHRLSAKVLVKDNERVTTGQVLARIDDRDFKVALDQARADVAAAAPRSPASRPRSKSSRRSSTRPRPPSMSIRRR